MSAESINFTPQLLEVLIHLFVIAWKVILQPVILVEDVITHAKHVVLLQPMAVLLALLAGKFYQEFVPETQFLQSKNKTGLMVQWH